MLRSGHASYQPVSSDVELNNLQNPFRDPQDPVRRQREPWSHKHLRGWRVGILSGASLAITVLILNFAVTISALKRQHSNDSGRRVLFEGDCHKAERINIAAHLLINAMSTILLSASNYGMQVLSAPTRSEVDVAHARKKWLDIGILSVRNIKNISPKRAWLWVLLGASSLPLHLLYNSAVFSTVTAHEYVIFSARPDMITADPNVSPLGISGAKLKPRKTGSYNMTSLATEMMIKAGNGSLTRLSASECLSAYAITFQTDYRHVILVTNDTGKLAGPRIYNNFASAIDPGSAQCIADPFDWVCGQDAAHGCMSRGATVCAAKHKSIKANEWEPLGQRVDHCLAEKLPGNCKVQFSTTIAWVVIAFNTSKALVLVGIFFLLRDDPMTTMGDAVASYLRVADETTTGLCLMSRDRLSLWRTPPAIPQPYKTGAYRNSRRWFQVVSGSRWRFCMFLYALAIGVCVFLFFYGIIDKPVPTSLLLSLPIGSLSPTAFIYGWSIPSAGSSGVIGNVLIANLPQVFLSMIYYTYNSLFTCFLAGREWASYGIERKGLRVSAGPRGSQRSTYFLQLPYKVAFPLMVLSGLLHWLTSQSIFLVSVQEEISGGTSTNEEFLTCGYSPIAILSVIILGCFMVAVVSFFGTRKFKGGMPIVATSSACISAFCHLSEQEKNTQAELRPVQWGVVSEGGDVGGMKSVSHCSFSSMAVRLPEEGELCAGLAKHVGRSKLD